MESYAHGKVKYNCGGVNGKIRYKHSLPVTATVSQFLESETHMLMSESYKWLYFMTFL